MHKFSVGDRVVIVGDEHLGEKGYVVEIDHSGWPLVRHDHEVPYGHSGGKGGTNKYHYWYLPHNLSFLLETQCPVDAKVTLPTTLPTGSQERKDIPLCTGVLDYFPAALAEVAKVSKAGNDKHNPGQPMHHARGKSTDHADCIIRHLSERGTTDPDDGQRHSAKVAWRSLALLQEELEAAGAPLARAAK